ncbi:DUF397 domain-containing protein [Streptomyces sodiiphilus]|uniref:DUF397 domain-containing protein n=1 Tax=Streptomyces sodiiphilus TaxID=226217 RepID=UPI0031E34134
MNFLLLPWQKSSYSSEGSACLEVAWTAGGLLLVRESDEPKTVLSTAPERLRALLTLASNARV